MSLQDKMEEAGCSQIENHSRQWNVGAECHASTRSTQFVEPFWISEFSNDSDSIEIKHDGSCQFTTISSPDVNLFSAIPAKLYR